jgi:group I intron endonuclease
MHVNKTNGKKYIGITHKSPQERWGHRGYQYRLQVFYKAILKYGWDGFEHIVIASGIEEKDAKNMEAELIRKFNTTSNNHGYNMTFGGEGNVPSVESRIKMSNSQKGRHHTEASKMLMSTGRKGKNNHNYGKKHSNETRQKISMSLAGEKHPNYGKPRTDAVKKKMSELFTGEKNPMAVSVINVETEKIFLTSKSAADYYGLHNSNIIKCCKGKHKTSGGYHWKYLLDHQQSALANQQVFLLCESR